MTDLIIHTGGAVGADNVFGVNGSIAGAKVKVHSFDGHDARTEGMFKENVEVIIHTQNELTEAYGNYVIPACDILDRRESQDPYICNILARDYFQVKDVDAVFAVGMVDEICPKLKVRGGTGYAVSMATIICIPKIYIFDQNTSEWRYFVGCEIQPGFFGYQAGVTKAEYIDISRFKSIAGIGTRNLTLNGLRAIKDLFRRR